MGAGCSRPTMPGTTWFDDGTTNYVAQIFKHPRTGPAIIATTENKTTTAVITWEQLETQVAAFAKALRDRGVITGDRVVGYLPDIPEAIIAFLGTASIGAVWAGCGQDMAPTAVAERLAQLEPVVLVTATGYHHRGGFVDRTDDIATLVAALPTLAATVVVERNPDANTSATTPAPGTVTWDEATTGDAVLDLATIPANHPLWVLFSSGTTGLPKGIVHSHAGVLIEHLKTVGLHLDMDTGDRFFWYTTLTWMMWNLRNSGLLVGATVVCFDGTPTGAALWEVAASQSVTTLGLSPGYLAACRNTAQHPARDHNLTALRTVSCTGSALTPDLHAWIANELGPDVLVGSTAGGTDIVTGLSGNVPTMPIVAGEISVRCLGVALEAWDHTGQSVTDTVGDLVVTQPMPSMPIYFWNDPDGSRYHSAYFDDFPNIWRHGDWITLNDRGSLIVHGRSDATLNRNGIRMGTSDIYRAVEALDEINEALVIGIEETDGTYWMPLFVTLADGIALGNDLRDRINSTIRSQVSPRHVPDEIIAAPGIPHTLTGKKIEVPIKRIMQGHGADAVQPEALDQPALLDWQLRASR